MSRAIGDFQMIADGDRVIAACRTPVKADALVAIAAASGRGVRILPIPFALLRAAAWLTRHLPGIGAISDAQVRRLLEDRDFAIEPMRQRLGVVPTPLAAGLAETFAAVASPVAAVPPASAPTMRERS